MSLGGLFHLLIYQPILNILILLYVYLPGRDLVWAVLLTTILLKLVLYPISIKAVKSQEIMSQIEPQIQKIRKEHKKDPAGQSKKIMALYKENNINPWSGMIYPLIQLPIMIAFFQIFKDLSILTLEGNLYSFIPMLDLANMTFLGNPNLAQPSIVLAIIVGFAQYWQQKTSGVGKNKSGWQKNMFVFFPFFTFFLLTGLSAVLGVYWLVNILFTIGQQYYLKRKPACSDHQKRKKLKKR